MNLSEISIRRPVFAWMLMTALIVFGSICFLRMGISQLPDVDFPVVSVNIRLEGAAPEVIETEIIDRVESAVMGIQGVRSVTSECERDEGTVTLEFELNRNIDLAVQDVQAAVANIQQRLPRDVSPPRISKTNPEDQPIIMLTVESKTHPLPYLMSYVNDWIKDQFSMVTGVGDVTLNGYRDPNLRVWLSEKQLKNNLLSVSDIIDTIQNQHSELPGGQLENGKKVLNIRTIGEATSIPEFGNLLINQRGGQPNFVPLHLRQVTRIEEGLADSTRLSRAMKVPCVGIGIRKQRGANAVEVAKAIRAKAAQIQKTLPEGMYLKINFDSSRYIEQAVQELKLTLILSIMLTAFVCWLFLGSWSSTLNVLLAMPTSIIGTFTVLYFAGFTLNTFTLLALSLSIGIVVDDAIMVMENIIRHQEKGENKFNAALLGTKEIAFAAIAATISIVAIFLPVAFMKGIIGKFFFQFGVAITVAVLLSLVEALTITPMRCSQFVDIGERKTRLGKLVDLLMDKIKHFYTRSLTGALNHRWKIIIVALIFFAASFSLLGFINKEFIPPEDQGRFNIRLSTPLGSALSYSDSRFAEVENFLSTRPEIDHYVLQVGGGSTGDSNKGSVLVTMKDLGHRGIDSKTGHELSQQDAMKLCRKALNKIPDVHAVIQDLSMKSFTASRGFPVEFTVQGPQWDGLAKYSRLIMDGLDKSGLVTDLDSNYQLGTPELHIIPDRAKAAAYGVNVVKIGETVNSMIGGVVVGSYPKGGHRYDIRLKLEDANINPLEKLNNLTIRNNFGELIPLSKLVTMEEKPSLLTVNRRDRARAITVYANVKAGQSQQKAIQAVEDISRQVLPADYHITMSGNSQSFSESFQSLTFALILGIFVAYMVLATQFNSFVDPLTVLIALPFSVSGAFVALFLSHKSLNIYSMIGLILLMGIVKKNSILLVDFTNQVRLKNNDQIPIKDALLQACPIRLRPILMTSVATIAGAIPAALALGAGAESRVPMAIAVIGGVTVSTLLTLYVVPCFYSLIVRQGKK